MKRYKTVDEFISGNEQWQEMLVILRDIILSTSIEETVKWGFPVYTVGGKNVVGLGAFKSYVGIWFFQGIFLNDEKKKLINAQEGKTKALLQWRFDSIEEIKNDAELIKAYVVEAILNQQQGKEIKPARNKILEIPEELQEKLNNIAELNTAYEQLSLSKRREYAEYISEAKRAATKTSRLEKIIPMILQGIGLNDKYKK